MIKPTIDYANEKFLITDETSDEISNGCVRNIK